MIRELPLRRAAVSDIPILVKHRRRMFEDMAALQGNSVDPARLDGMDRAYTVYLKDHLTDGTFWACGIAAEPGGLFVASAAISLTRWIPGPGNDTLVCLHSVYTDPAYRRCGLARRTVQAAVDFCRAQGFRRLVLHASPMGRPLYESLGFALTNEMALEL